MSGGIPELPWAQIDTVFLDAGNTLVSIDFDRVAAELGVRGVTCTPSALRRAEAKARPVVSRGLESLATTESPDAFLFYVECVLAMLPEASAHPAGREALAKSLAGELRSQGDASRLWCWVIPGVEDALRTLGALGLRRVVVSNSDGSVTRGLSRAGLIDNLEGVVDSFEEGVEKPDPRIFQQAMERYGVDPARSLHVGDLYAADVVGARAAGIHPVLLDPFGDWEGVDCTTVEDLPALCARFLEAR